MNSSNSKSEKSLAQVFEQQFQGSSQERLLQLRRGTAPWDSLKHIELVNAIEAEFRVRFSFAEATSANSFEEILAILNQLPRR
ncbi:MAG: acyl carrier protein [Deltaproteobacteria bacterium]|jgi:acyl carrier protein|nr:acyl carrier protein [Deltaproteobacteria bacterium]